MFRVIRIGAVAFLVLVVIGALWMNERAYRSAHSGVKGPVDADFPQGGNIKLDLSAGAYTIRGTSENKIHVRYWVSDYVKDGASIDLQTNDREAKLTVRGPHNDFRVQIDVPEKSNIRGSLSAGKLAISGVEGDKELEAGAGKLDIDVGDPAQYKDVEAFVVSGKLQAHPWSANKAGMFRNFEYHGGRGPYTLRAHMAAGKLTLSRSGPMTPQTEAAHQYD